MTVLDQLIERDKLKSLEGEKIYNFLVESDSSRFYSELFSAEEKKEKPELYDQQKDYYREKDGAYQVMNGIVARLKAVLDDDAVVVELGGGVHQRRSGNAYKEFKNYFPLDISDTSIRGYSERFDKVGFIADATKLPFKPESVDCVLTHTFLEHPLQPESVLEEIARVLKPGGFVVHNDAWFCRWWQRYGVVGLKRFSSMTAGEKLVTIGSKITEL
ncbi:MAG: class I SAM-dependent methyltransferase, partial [Bacteroidota bacterium]